MKQNKNQKIDVSELKGMLPKPKKKVSIENMRRIIVKRGAGSNRKNQYLF
jgi:hypothetical protein